MDLLRLRRMKSAHHLRCFGDIDHSHLGTKVEGRRIISEDAIFAVVDIGAGEAEHYETLESAFLVKDKLAMWIVVRWEESIHRM